MGPSWRKCMSVLRLDPSEKKQTCILYLVKSCQSLERHILADQHHHQQSDNPVHTCAHQEQTPNHRCLHRNTGSATFLQTCQLPNWQHMSIRFYFWVLLCTIVYLWDSGIQMLLFFSVLIWAIIKGHFTVMDGSEPDGDLVLVQTFLLYYVNQVILILTCTFQWQFP